MAYNKKTWLARLGQGLNKFILNGGSKVTLESSPDTVTQQGTPLSAENMNDLEDRIDSEFTNVNSAINAISDTLSGFYFKGRTMAPSTGTLKITFGSTRGNAIFSFSSNSKAFIYAIHSTGSGTISYTLLSSVGSEQTVSTGQSFFEMTMPSATSYYSIIADMSFTVT